MPGKRHRKRAKRKGETAVSVLDALEIQQALVINSECSTPMLRQFFFTVHGYRAVARQCVDRQYLISRTIQSLHKLWRDEQKGGHTSAWESDGEAKVLSIAYMVEQFKDRLVKSHSRQNRKLAPRKQSKRLMETATPLPRRPRATERRLKRKPSRLHEHNPVTRNSKRLKKTNDKPDSQAKIQKKKTAKTSTQKKNSGKTSAGKVLLSPSVSNSSGGQITSQAFQEFVQQYDGDNVHAIDFVEFLSADKGDKERAVLPQTGKKFKQRWKEEDDAYEKKLNLRRGNEKVGPAINTGVSTEGLLPDTFQGVESSPVPLAGPSCIGHCPSVTEGHRGNAMVGKASNLQCSNSSESTDEVLAAFRDDLVELENIKSSNRFTTMHLFNMSVVQKMSDQIRASANEIFQDIHGKIQNRTHTFRDSDEEYKSDTEDYCVA